MAVLITAARYHFQITMISQKILHQQHINIDCAEIIFQNTDMLTFSDQIRRIFL